jgi:hypothetical protein
MNRDTAKVIARRAERKQEQFEQFEQKCKAAPTSFFIKHGGRTIKNPHYVLRAKRK